MSEIDGRNRARIEHIADMIREGKWRYGETYKALAREWDLSYDRVRDIGAEAHAIVRSEIADPDQVTPNVCVVLSRVLTEAYEKGDYGQAIAAAREWTRLAYHARDAARSAAFTADLGVAVLESVIAAIRSTEQ